jgi:arylsulfatase A-like enzyme
MTRLRVLVIVAALAAAACTEAPRPRSAILVLLDTLRADRLGASGHRRPTTPALDRLAERGVLFEQVISYSAWTLPSVVAMLSGRFPTRRVFDETLQRSLVEDLRDAGFRTAAFTEGGFLSRYYGFDLGFERYWDEAGGVHLGLRAPLRELTGAGIESTFPAAEAWLRENAKRPFFLMVHTYEVHTPYYRRSFARDLPRGRLDPTLDSDDLERIKSGALVLGETEYAYLDALYDGGVLKADDYVGRLLVALDDLGIADSTLVIVTSDHGEELEGRFPRFAAGHGHSLFDELVRVPLILFDPTREYPVRRVASQVRTVDVVPTILDLLGTAADPTLDGRSLVPLMVGSEREDRLAFSYLDLHGPERAAVRFAGFKLIRNLEAARSAAARHSALFDLRRDPAERRDVSRKQPAALQRASVQLDAVLERIDAEGRPSFPNMTDVPDELQERLRALGYVD